MNDPQAAYYEILSKLEPRRFEWQLLKGFTDGHSYWEKNGKVSVCDRSGSTPDLTDDGPLWIKDDQPIVLNNRGGCMKFTVPCVQERTNRACHFLANLAEVMWLVSQGMSLQVHDEEGDRWKIARVYQET